MIRLFASAFALSGAAGLFYELLWTRYLALYVGHTAYAQVLVLSVFLGGLAIGSMAVGDRARSIRNPLRWYITVELGLAIFGLVYHPLYEVVTSWAYDHVFPMLGDTVAQSIAKWGLAVALILPQAVMLGATFPLLTAALVRRNPGGEGHGVSILYAANSLGGAVGVLVAGFLALRWLGLPGSLGAAVGMNLMAAALAWIGERRYPELSGSQPESDPERREPSGLWRLMLLVAGGTAVASFLYEIAWIRMLSLVMGSATHAFELIVSAFIFGLGLGAILVRKRADGSQAPLALLAGIQWLMGLAAMATLPLYLLSFPFTGFLVDQTPATGAGYLVFNVARYGVALTVMLPATILAGTTLPLITAILIRGGGGERSIGWVYGINAMGSALGVVTAGLLLLPVLGLKGTLLAGAGLDMALGAVIWRSRAGLGETGAFSVSKRGFVTLTAAIIVLATVAPMNRVMLSSGVFRRGSQVLNEEKELLFYRDGRTATVSAVVDPARELVVLSTNGKPDASLSFRWLRAARDSAAVRNPIRAQDEATQMLAALVALAHNPEAETAALVGHGSGMTGQFLLASPRLTALETIEIEPEMIEGSKVFYPANARVFDDPRSSFSIGDAKSFFSQSGERYDVIVSEPSNPWVGGVAGLFTVEFYQRVRRYLSEDGLFVQWFHLYEMTDPLVESILSALHHSFADYDAYLISRSDVVFVASLGSMSEADWSVMEWPAVRRDLAHVTRFTPGALESMWMFDRDVVAPLLESSQPNSDFRPVLDLEAERARFLDLFATGVYGLAGEPFRLGWGLTDRRTSAQNTIWPMPVEAHVPMQRWGFSTWLRHALADSVPPLAPDRRYRMRLLIHQNFRGRLESGGPPDSWRDWLGSLRPLETELHSGLPGAGGTRFLRSAREFARRNDAPGAVNLSLAFLEALSSFDFETLAAISDTLLAPRQSGNWWLPPELLMDGAAVAYLRMGRPNDAERVVNLLLPLTDRGEDDFRVRLLLAHARIEGESDRN